MITGALTAAGYRTGSYTSPHLDRLEERISIDGVDCTPAELVELVDAVRGVVAKLDQETQACDRPGSPTALVVYLWHPAVGPADGGQTMTLAACAVVVVMK